MTKPFDYYKSEVPLDLTNQLHRDLVVKRNKNLETALKNNIPLDKVSLTIRASIVITCVKCGTAFREYNESRIDTENQSTQSLDIDSCMPDLECYCCKTKYKFDPYKQSFKVMVPKPKTKRKRV
ncbi:hypothetical protein ACFFVB_18300 [Formosa undariae]|uniref:Uncharacterized protein n=1 Tax=Formosa undariae TaxID=1325436 RepID=A0ABV5F6G7_9FLAO